MPRPLHLVNRILRALLTVGALGLIAYRFLGDADDWQLIAAIVLAVTAVGLSPALWPALPAAAEKPAAAPAPPQAPQQPAYQPPQQQYQPPQQAYPPQQGTTYGGHAQVPQQQQQQQQWPGHQQQ